MKILLINPPAQGANKNLDFSDFILLDKFYMGNDSMPHLGLGYLHAVLLKEGHDVFTAEMFIQSLNIKDLERIIEQNNIELIGSSSYSYNFKSTMQLANSLKRKYPNIFYITGGYFPTLATKPALNNLSVDCCVIGEGEVTVSEIAKKLSNNHDWRNVDGIAYKNANGDIVINKPRRLIENLDELPFPNRIFSDVPKLVGISSSRGCYGNCNYCSINSFYKKCKGSKARRRSPENTVEEIIYLKEKYNFELFYFIDDNFGMSSANDRKWFEKFYSLIKEKKISIQFGIETRANEVASSFDIIKKFKEIGLEKVTVGVESFSQAQLDYFNKSITVNENIEALKILSSLNIRYNFNLILFDIRSTISEIIKCIEIIKGLDFLFKDGEFHIFYYFTLTLTEGTDISEYVKNEKAFANNNHQFKLINEDVKQLHAAIKSWDKKYSLFYAYEFLYEVSKIVCDNLITKKLEYLYKSVFKMQIDVLLYACTLAKQNMDSDQIYILLNENYNKHIEDYLNQLKILYDIVKKNCRNINNAKQIVEV